MESKKKKTLTFLEKESVVEALKCALEQYLAANECAKRQDIDELIDNIDNCAHVVLDFEYDA